MRRRDYGPRRVVWEWWHPSNGGAHYVLYEGPVDVGHTRDALAAFVWLLAGGDRRGW